MILKVIFCFEDLYRKAGDMAKCTPALQMKKHEHHLLKWMYTQPVKSQISFYTLILQKKSILISTVCNTEINILVDTLCYGVTMPSSPIVVHKILAINHPNTCFHKGNCKLICTFNRHILLLLLLKKAC